MRRILAVAALTLGLGACVSDMSQQPPAVPVAAAPLPTPPLGFEMAPAETTATPGDVCGAGKLQWLVGKPKAEIPVPVDPGLRRVTCTSCPMTMDFNPRRLNILFDEPSGIVKEVKCG
jgi:hypothetical protein